VRVTLYSRPGCHLCDELKHDLAELQASLDFHVIEHDIDQDPEAFARFRYLIPVLDVEDGPLLYPPHDWLTLMQSIQKAQRQSYVSQSA
jgi:hypothetical protein